MLPGNLHPERLFILFNFLVIFRCFIFFEKGKVVGVPILRVLRFSPSSVRYRHELVTLLIHIISLRVDIKLISLTNDLPSMSLLLTSSQYVSLLREEFISMIKHILNYFRSSPPVFLLDCSTLTILTVLSHNSLSSALP